MLLCCSVRADAGMPRDNFLTRFSAYPHVHIIWVVPRYAHSTAVVYIHNTILYMYITHTRALNVGILILSHLFIHAHAYIRLQRRV